MARTGHWGLNTPFVFSESPSIDPAHNDPLGMAPGRSLTGGGPGTSTMVVELYIFAALVRTSLPGIASAVSALLFLVSLLLIVPLFAVRRRANEEGVR